MQTRTLSAVESVANTLIGLGVGLLGQLIVFPAVGLAVSWPQNGAILIAFTIISIARNYAVRRLFNWLFH